MADSEDLPINKEQSRGLIAKLSEIGLFLNRSGTSGSDGWIEVKNRKKDHPVIKPGTYCNVGFLVGGESLHLCHLDKIFPEDYHQKLRQLYKEVTGEQHG